MRRSLRVRDQRRSRGKDASSSSSDDDDEARGNWARSRFLVRLLLPDDDDDDGCSRVVFVRKEEAQRCVLKYE